MVWADLYIGDKSKLNKSPVSVAVYNIVSSKTVIFSLYINIAGFNVLASTISVCSLAKLNNVIIGVVLTVALNKKYIFFRSFGFIRSSLLRGVFQNAEQYTSLFPRNNTFHNRTRRNIQL